MNRPQQGHFRVCRPWNPGSLGPIHPIEFPYCQDGETESQRKKLGGQRLSKLIQQASVDWA